MSIHYTNAPIADAVIDVQVTFTAPIPAEALLAFAKSLEGSFPHRHEIHHVEVQIDENMGESKLKSEGVMGYRLANADQSRVLQVRTNGISYGHLPKYTTWERYRAEFEPFLKAYIEQFRPDVVSRLAVRYINQIQTPQNIDVATYLNVSPRLVPATRRVANYFLQLILRQDEWPASWGVILNTGIAGSSEPDKMSILLDLDVYCEQPQNVDTGTIWGVMERLRTKKNELFEAAITDATRELIR